MAVLAVKFVLWLMISVAMVFVVGWGLLPASALAAWFLFWPR